jgi:dTDP-glucose 4,6-dehydratase
VIGVILNTLITGGAGFIGSRFTHGLLSGNLGPVPSKLYILDALTYSGDLVNLGSEVLDHPNVEFVHGDIRDSELVESLVHESDVVINFAAESHVDRSILNPSLFLDTNAGGTMNILNAMRSGVKKRLIQISTDEVYGSISSGSWDESFPLRPNSPYSASKASADLLSLAFHKTYGLDVVITRCCNNYGPNQFPEKLIPLFIKRLIKDEKVPVYGSGLQTREWIHVDDHCRGIYLAMTQGEPGDVYNLGTDTEITNIDLTKMLLSILGKDSSLIEYVDDRLGHDQRYSLNNSKSKEKLGFIPQVDFEKGLKETVAWYLQYFNERQFNNR